MNRIMERKKGGLLKSNTKERIRLTLNRLLSTVTIAFKQKKNPSASGVLINFSGILEYKLLPRRVK